MTDKELERSKAIHMANEKRLTQNTGAKQLKISERHFRRLLRRYREKGDAPVTAVNQAIIAWGKKNDKASWT